MFDVVHCLVLCELHSSQLFVCCKTGLASFHIKAYFLKLTKLKYFWCSQKAKLVKTPKLNCICKFLNLDPLRTNETIDKNHYLLWYSTYKKL